MGVSVVIAVWNGAAYLREAIDSVLGQTVLPSEVIVVDDGSTDDTPAILASYGDAIRVLRQDNRGQSAATAAGVGIAREDMLAFQDADDLWMPRKIELQVTALADDPGLDAVFGMSEQFVSPELDDEEKRRWMPGRAVLRGEISTCMTLRRSAYDRFGGFKSVRNAAFFFDWLGRAKTAGLKSLMLDDIVHRRRLHRSNFGRVHTEVRDNQLLETLQRHIARKRAQGSNS